MTAAELAHCVAKAAGCSDRHSTKMLNLTLRMIVAATERGEKVSLRGFGTFMMVERKARRAKCMGKAFYEVPAHRKLVLRASGSMMRPATEKTEDDSA